MEAYHTGLGHNGGEQTELARVFLAPAWFIACGLGAILGGFFLRGTTFSWPMMMLGAGVALVGAAMLYRNVTRVRWRQEAAESGPSAGVVVASGTLRPPLGYRRSSSQTSVWDILPGRAHHRWGPPMYVVLLEAAASPLGQSEPGSCSCSEGSPRQPLREPSDGAIVLGLPVPVPVPAESEGSTAGPEAGTEGACTDTASPQVSRPHQHHRQQHPQQQPPKASPACQGASSLVLVLQPHPELMGYTVEVIRPPPPQRQHDLRYVRQHREQPLPYPPLPYPPLPYPPLPREHAERAQQQQLALQRRPEREQQAAQEVQGEDMEGDRQQHQQPAARGECCNQAAAQGSPRRVPAPQPASQPARALAPAAPALPAAEGEGDSTESTAVVAAAASLLTPAAGRQGG